MKSFIRKIFEKETDENVHGQFVRFGKGDYSGRAVTSFNKTGGKIKARGSFEFANDFLELCCDISSKLKISGIILSKEDFSNLLSQNKIQAISEEKKGGLFYKNNIDEQEVDSRILKEIVKKSYFSLLDAEAPGILLKMKKSLPKPGKGGEAKIDDKFCILEADEKFWPKIKDVFFWDLDGKKASASHTYRITEIVLPKGEKDFEKIRLLSKRKGKIIRKMTADGKETSKEIEFEA